MVRRKLQFSVEEWESLPWWQQDVYIEGLLEEFNDDGDSSEAPPQRQAGPRSTIYTEPDSDPAGFDAFDATFGGSKSRRAG